MATIIDTLLVTFGLDVKDFQKNTKEVGEAQEKTRVQSDKVAKDVSESGKVAAEFFTRLRNEALLAATVFTGGLGLKEFIGQTVTADAATGRMAANLHMSTDELSLWKESAKYAGGSAAGLESAFRGIAAAVESFQLTGEQNGITKLLYQLHIPFEDAKGNLRDVAEIFKDISDRIHSHDDRALALGGLLGLDDGTLNYAKQGGAAIQKLHDQQRNLFHITTEDAEAATKLQIAWNKLGDTSRETGTKILTYLTPALEKALDLMTTGIRWHETGHDPSREFRGTVHYPTSWTPGVGTGALGAAPFGARVPDNLTTHSPHWTPNELFRHRMQVLNEELSASPSDDDRAAIMREISGVQWSYARSVLGSIGGGGASGGGTSNSTSVSIGHQTINTQASDARGIAYSIMDQLQAAALQANSGMTQ